MSKSLENVTGDYPWSQGWESASTLHVIFSSQETNKVKMVIHIFLEVFVVFLINRIERNSRFQKSAWTPESIWTAVVNQSMASNFHSGTKLELQRDRPQSVPSRIWNLTKDFSAIFCINVEVCSDVSDHIKYVLKLNTETGSRTTYRTEGQNTLDDVKRFRLTVTVAVGVQISSTSERLNRWRRPLNLLVWKPAWTTKAV